MKIIEDALRDVTSLGGLLFSLLILIGVMLAKEWKLFVQLLIGSFLILVIVASIRFFYYKPRPLVQKYKTTIERIDASAFPSLHAARLTFLFLCFSYFFSKLGWTVFFFVLLGLGFYSRIYLRKHDWKDILCGLVVGVSIFFLVRMIV